MLVAFITAAMDTQFDYCAGRNATSLTPNLYGSVVGRMCTNNNNNNKNNTKFI